MRRLPAIILLLGLLLRWWISLTKPEVLWIDDSFYSLGIARNMALGNGWTHGGTHITNGFQPLYVFVMVPFYWILPQDGTLIPILALLLEAVLNIATGWLLYQLVSRRIGERGALVALIAWCFSPYTISGVNGLETPIQVFLLMLVTYMYVMQWRAFLTKMDAHIQAQAKIALILGALLGLCILARIDSAIFVALLLGDLVIRLLLILRKDKIYWHRISKILIYLLLSVAFFIVCWYAASYINTGRLEFDSGIANRLATLNSYNGSSLILDNFKTLLSNLQYWVLTAILPWSHWVQRGLLALSLLFLIFLSLWGVRRKLTTVAFSIGGDLAFVWLYSVGLPAAYVLYQFTEWNWHRYFYPLALTGLILLGAFVELMFESLERAFRESRWPSAVSLMYAAVCVGYIVVIPFSLPKEHNPIIGQPEDWVTKAQYDAAAWLRENTEADSRVAAFQSGIIGYFSGHQVINLDGVVNRSVLPFIFGGDVADYLDTEDITYLVDWENLLERNFGVLPNSRTQYVASFDAAGGGRVGLYRWLESNSS